MGDGLLKASERAFSQTFIDVKNITSLEEGKHNSFNIIFTPTIREFEISQTITTGFFLRATIFDNTGKVIYENEVRGKTKGSTSCVTACLGDVFLGESALSQSVNSAFEDAFEKLFINIMETLDFSKMY